MTNLENFKQEERTIEPSKVNLYAILYALPFMLFFSWIYWAKWGDFQPGKQPLIVYIGAFAVLLIGSAFHELIHGITWSMFTKQGMKSMKFGVLWKALMPYCHCKEPLSVKGYMIGAVMPAVILGFTPSILAIILGNPTLMVFGVIFTLTAGGDFMMLDILRKEPKENLVLDHPSKVGCYIYRPLNGELDPSV